MPLTNYKVGDRVRIKQNGHTGTVTEVREHAPSGRGGYYIVQVVVRVDGGADACPFNEVELEQIT
jgi:hypothetical protein